ncbi:MAG: GFA family protein [Nocardioides sp.]
MVEAGAESSGRCLCGQISYVVRGPLRDVLICHCGDCRRWHGHTAAMTSARRRDVLVNEPESVRWFMIPGNGPRPRRGFCPTCGSSLFWDAPERLTIGISAGSLDQPTGLHSAGHVYVAQAADYELLVDDGLPHRAAAASSDAAVAPS